MYTEKYCYELSLGSEPKHNEVTRVHNKCHGIYLYQLDGIFIVWFVLAKSACIYPCVCYLGAREVLAH